MQAPLARNPRKITPRSLRLARHVNFSPLCLYNQTLLCYNLCNVASKVSNYSLNATMGFDIYVGERFVGVFVPPFDTVDSYGSLITPPCYDGSMQEYTINPISNEVKELLIGIPFDQAEIFEINLSGDEGKFSIPCLYKGHSISHLSERGIKIT